MEYSVRRMLGGFGNGEDVPKSWDSPGETWVQPGTDNASHYSRRVYYHGADRIVVWVEDEITPEAFFTIMHWHRRMFNHDLADAQKVLLKEGVAAGADYTKVIMAVGYAALFALWSYGRGEFTPITTFVSGILMVVSVMTFVALEFFGMIFRWHVNLSLARVANDPENFQRLIGEHAERMQGFTLRFQRPWGWSIALAASTAAIAFLVMLSALVHGAWLVIVAETCPCG